MDLSGQEFNPQPDLKSMLCAMLTATPTDPDVSGLI
jgi:hypothetical protein